MKKVIISRRCQGGRFISFKSKPKHNNVSPENTVSYSTPEPEVKMVSSSKKVPTDAETKRNKPKMDSMIQKLQGLHVKKKNITFDF